MKEKKARRESRKVRRGMLRRPILVDFAATFHERIYQENLSKVVKSLGKDHPIKVLLSEHEQAIRSLYILNKANEGLEKSGKFENVTIELWELLGQAIQNLKMADLHFNKEENALFPELAERGFYTNVKMIMAEHKEVHELIGRLIEAFDGGLEDNFEETVSAINAIVITLSDKLRKLIFKENYVLYPAALRLIQGERAWSGIRAAWGSGAKYRINNSHTAA